MRSSQIVYRLENIPVPDSFQCAGLQLLTKQADLSKYMAYRVSKTTAYPQLVYSISDEQVSQFGFAD